MEREEEIKEIAQKYGMSLHRSQLPRRDQHRPECPPQRVVRPPHADGRVHRFLSQSGALCTAVLDYAHAKNIGFSKFVSFGNKADISDIDLMLALKDDPATKVILMYLEEMTDGAAFVDAARQVIHEAGKPVLVLKSGRTQQGPRPPPRTPVRSRRATRSWMPR